MKISFDPNHPDYHDVVHFIDKIQLDDTVLENCVHLDTELNEVECVTLPIKPLNGMIPTHTVRGKVGIVWKETQQSANGLLGAGTRSLFLDLLNDWKLREANNGL